MTAETLPPPPGDAVAPVGGGAAARPGPLDAWIDSWSAGGGRAWRPVLLLLAAFVAVWTTVQAVAHSSMGLHPDVLEVYAWSRHPSLGYYKHPPLNAWVAFAWLRLFPAADWSMHLLAMTSSAAALFATDLIARRYLDGPKRLLALILLMLTPFYQFFADNFSTNQVMLLTWPIATWCFLLAYERRTLGWSIAAGVAAAAAMLAKYYSVYLLGSFALAVLLQPGRWTYLRSPSPWISVLAGLAALTPNLWWLVTTGFQPFHYAYAVHGNTTLARILAKDASYIAGALGYVALPIVVYAIAVRPSLRQLADALWPADPRRRMLVTLLAGQLLLAPLTAPLLGDELTPLWTMQAWFLLPVVLLSPPGAVLPRPRLRAAIFLLAGISAALLVAAPVAAVMAHRTGDKSGRTDYPPAAAEITRLWRQATGRPLRIVRGDLYFASAAEFYAPDHPDAVPGYDLSTSPWVTPARLDADGWTMICPDSDPTCLGEVQRHQREQPGASLRRFQTTSLYFGVASPPGHFTLLIVPPKPPRPAAPAAIPAP